MTSQVTLKSVASRAGVSYQTVSKVLNGQIQVAPETRERILKAADELGYRPNQIARNMRAQRSHMIGYSWLPTSPDQINQILDQFLSSMVHEAEAAGYHLLPFPFRDGHVDDYRELIDTGRVDGFVISSINFDDPRISFLMERKFPFVGFGRSNPDWNFPYVDVDGTAGLNMATRHLIEKGHRMIGALAWPEDSRVGNDRVAGFFEAMRTAGIEVHPEWIERGEGTFEFGYQASRRLLSLPKQERPTALVAMSDTMAIGGIHAAREYNLEVGRDIDIIGFDDAPMSQYLFPALTTVRQPIRDAGRKCVEVLVSLMKGDELAQSQILLPPTLIIRSSA
ncbi:MAG: LacI family DNA-binding transcriptional regulator [Bacteroidota bacterium]